MAVATLDRIQKDDKAMSVASALSVANEAALAQGADLAQALVTITEELAPPGGALWRIHYGPRDFVARRGGDLIVLVDQQTATVQKIVRGQ